MASLRISHTLESSKEFNQTNRTEDNYFRMVMKEIGSWFESVKSITPSKKNI